MKRNRTLLVAPAIALSIGLIGAAPASATITVPAAALQIGGGEHVFPFGTKAELTLNGTPRQVWRVGSNVTSGALQQLVGGTWKDLGAVKVSRYSSILNSVEVSPSAANMTSWRQSGTVQLRLRLSSAGLSDWTGPTLTVKVPKLSYSLAKTVMPFSASSSITYQGHWRTLYWSPSSVKQVQLQRLDGKTWKTVTTTIVPSNGLVKQTLSKAEADSRRGTTAQYRLAVSHPDYNTWYGPAQKVTFAKTTPSVGYQELSAVSNPFTKSFRASTKAYIYNADGQKAYLERYDTKRKKWVTAATATVRSSSAKATIPSATAARTSTKLRWRVAATTKSNQATTSSTSVRVDNPSKYTGYTKTVYNLVKKYCPNAAIDSRNRIRKSANSFQIGGAFGSDHYFWVANGYKGEQLKNLALHECAHLWQYDISEKNGGWSKLQTRLNKIYKTKGNDGVEQSATCMANQWGAKLIQGMNYTTNCKGARASAAKAMTKRKMP